MYKIVLIIGIIVMINTTVSATEKVIPFDDIKWGLLNPARGDKSPKAFDLWGDRTKNKATGMLVKFEPNFSSPPHIHNITYKGIVIEGLVHNDSQFADYNWLPSGSYWLQPAGQEHVTAAEEVYNMAYIEIDSGPYLVEPIEKAFDTGENPITARAENINWKKIENKIEIASLWGASAMKVPHGFMLKLPTNSSTRLDIEAQDFHLVVIKGAIEYKKQILKKGSYIGNSGKENLLLNTENEAIIYIRTNGKVSIL